MASAFRGLSGIWFVFLILMLIGVVVEPPQPIYTTLWVYYTIAVFIPWAWLGFRLFEARTRKDEIKQEKELARARAAGIAESVEIAKRLREDAQKLTEEDDSR